jgi:hypothetical protein
MLVLHLLLLFEAGVNIGQENYLICLLVLSHMISLHVLKVQYTFARGIESKFLVF